MTYITIHTDKKITSSIFGGTISFYFLGSAIIPVIAKILYLQDALLPFWLIIIFAVIILPLGFILQKNARFTT